MNTATPSRIQAARTRAETAKHALAVAALAAFGFLLIVFHGGSAAAHVSSPGAAAAVTRDSGTGSIIGGGSIAQAPQSSPLPQAQTATS
jgi:hypothetical protein